MTTTPPHRLPRSLHWLIGLALTVLVTACSLPVDERVTPIDQDEFGAQLTEDTTTTTTEPPTTTSPSTVPDQNDPGQSTTTLAAIQTQAVTTFYTRGYTDVMQPVEFQLAEGTPVLELVPLLERPPIQVTQADFRSSVRPGLVDDIVVDHGPPAGDRPAGADPHLLRDPRRRGDRIREVRGRRRRLPGVRPGVRWIQRAR
jgi:hypothetical protein